MRLAATSFSLLWCAACTAVNPAFDQPGPTAGDTEVADTEAPPGSTTRPMTSADTEVPGEGTGDTGVVTDTDAPSTEGPSETGTIPSCQPEEVGRPLDIRIYDANTGSCGPPEVDFSLVDFVRIPESDAYTGRVCNSGCGGPCPVDPTDLILRLEVPADVADFMSSVGCLDLRARVDHAQGCRVDFVAAWFDGGMKSKAPEIVGATEAVPSGIIGSSILPSYEWVPSDDACGGVCQPDPDGEWALKVDDDKLITHDSEEISALIFEGGVVTDTYTVFNLRSFIDEACEPHFAWFAMVE